jgi:SAM-dependent methyltransferase
VIGTFNQLLLQCSIRLSRLFVNRKRMHKNRVQPMCRLIRARKLQARIRVRWGNVVKLPFAARTFDKVFTVNTIYYWPDLSLGLREITRVLKPGGRLMVGFRSPASLRLVTLAWDNFKRYEPQEVAAAMRNVGFRLLRVEHPTLSQTPDDLVLMGEYKKRSPR